MTGFNNRLRQIMLLALIILIGVLMVRHFYIFLQGVLGAITLYILSRKTYFKLTEKKKWRPGWTALLYILDYTVLICLPVYLASVLVTPKLIAIFKNPVRVLNVVKSFLRKIKDAPC